MTTTLWLKRYGPNLCPYDPASTEEFAKLPVDKALFVEISQPRNYERLKLRWALINVVAKGVGEDPEDVSDKIKIACGHFKVLYFPNGRIERKAKSISYSQMDETAFAAYFEKEVTMVYELYGILPKDAQREIDAILSPRTEKTR